MADDQERTNGTTKVRGWLQIQKKRHRFSTPVCQKPWQCKSAQSPKPLGLRVRSWQRDERASMSRIALNHFSPSHHIHQAFARRSSSLGLKQFPPRKRKKAVNIFKKYKEILLI